MAKIFRLLIIDDKKPVLNAMKDWIEHNYKVANEDYTDFSISDFQFPISCRTKLSN